MNEKHTEARARADEFADDRAQHRQRAVRFEPGDAAVNDGIGVGIIGVDAQFDVDVRGEGVVRGQFLGDGAGGLR